MARPLPGIATGLADCKHLTVWATRSPVFQEEMEKLEVELTFLLDVDHQPQVVIRCYFEFLFFKELNLSCLSAVRLVNKASLGASTFLLGSRYSLANCRATQSYERGHRCAISSCDWPGSHFVREFESRAYSSAY